MKNKFYAIWSKSEMEFLTESDVSNNSSQVPILGQDGCSGITKGDLEAVIEDNNQEADWEVAEVTLTLARV